jgi:hypothetical protein
MSIAISTIKKALKVDYSTDDQELIRIRDAVVAFVQNYTGITIETTTKTQYVGYWMKTRLMFNPFVDMVSVKYTDVAGVVQTMPTTDYFIIRNQYPSIYINFSEYPSIKTGTEIQINYKVGSPVMPADLQQLIISLIGHWYNNPEAGAPINISTVPLSAQFIMENMKVKGAVE